MSDYLITMDTGEKFLAHYGVRGMKWGQWNAETKARYSNAGNSTYYKKAKRGSEYGKSVTDLRREYNANQPKSKQIAKNVLLAPGEANPAKKAREAAKNSVNSTKFIIIYLFSFLIRGIFS